VPEPAPGFPEVELNVRGVRVHVYATHLDYRPEPDVRRRQVADMMAVMAEDRGRPRVLVGDFNAGHDATELAPLWTELVDAWSAAGEGAPGLTYPADAPASRIDYVTAARLVEVWRVTVPATAPATTASDHLPVLADLRVARRH